MDDELYPPGMAPPKNHPAKAAPAPRPSSQPKSSIAKPTSPSSRSTAPQFPPGTSPNPSEESIYDATRLSDELLPDEALPPSADDTNAQSGPLAPRAENAFASADSPHASPDRATNASTPLRLSTAPKAAQLAHRKSQRSITSLVLTISTCVALLFIAAALLMRRGQPSPAPASVAQSAPAQPPIQPSAIPPRKTPPRIDPRRRSDSSWAAPPASSLEVDQSPTRELPTEPPPPATAPSDPPGPSPATPAPTLKVTHAEIEQLIKSLETAKTALSEQNEKLADAELTKAESLAKVPTHQAAVSRLKELRRHVQQFNTALRAAAAERQAGETFKVGNSTQVSFVEATADKLIVRIAGMNKSYLLNDLPPGLALALVDFKLPPADAHTKLLKGAYLLVHQRADSDTQAKVRELWQEAQSGGRETAHLVPLLNEAYADFLKDSEM